MGYFFEPLGFFLLVQLLTVATAVVLAVKTRGAASILAWVAAGMWLLRAILQRWLGTFGSVPGFLALLATTLFLIAVILAPLRSAQPAWAPQGTPAGAPQEVPRRERISKGLYLGWIIPCQVLALISSGIMTAMRAEREYEAVLFFSLLALALMAVVVVLVTRLLHKLWAAIQDGSPRTTPGKAVGFLFIPLFNFYWVFQAIRGWAVDFNRYAAERKPDAPRVSVGLATAVCIIAFFGAIPVVGLVTGLIQVVLLARFLSAACDGVNSLNQSP